MVLKSAFAAALCTGFLIWGGPAMADEYRAGEFLGLDLPKALLSPKRLGPEAQFAPVPIEAKTERAQARVEPRTAPRIEPKIEPKTVRTTRVTDAPPKAERPRPVAERPRAAARTEVTKRRSNPLDAQARDTRIQTWPCRSGGICGWQR